jgi:hypothetical protein
MRGLHGREGPDLLHQPGWEPVIALQDQAVGAVQPVADLVLVPGLPRRGVFTRQPESESVLTHHPIDAGLHLLVHGRLVGDEVMPVRDVQPRGYRVAQLHDDVMFHAIRSAPDELALRHEALFHEPSAPYPVAINPGRTIAPRQERDPSGAIRLHDCRE